MNSTSPTLEEAALPVLGLMKLKSDDSFLSSDKPVLTSTRYDIKARRAEAATKIQSLWRGWLDRTRPLSSLWRTHVRNYRSGLMGFNVPNSRYKLPGKDPREMYLSWEQLVNADEHLPKLMALPPRARHYIENADGWKERFLKKRAQEKFLKMARTRRRHDFQEMRRKQKKC